MRTIIIDDYSELRQALKHMLSIHCPSVEIIEEAASVNEGYEKIKKLKPDLVFLDIKLGNENSFEILSKFEVINFKIIFVTAHEEFAIKAFKFNAINYLLKPIDKDELIDAVKQAETILEGELLTTRMHFLSKALNQEKPQLKKIVLKTFEEVHSVNISDIIRCESEKNYTTFFLQNNKKLIVSVLLKEYTELLSPMGFFRTHQSHLINLDWFDYFIKKDGGIIVMKDKSQVPIASRKKEEFLNILSKL